MRDVAIGHNNPPSEVEILKQRLDDYTGPKEQYKRLSERIIPEAIENDKQAGNMSDYISAVKLLQNEISDIHKKEKQPFWDAGKAADAWKNDFLDKCDALVKSASAPLLVWNKKKEAEERARQLEIARKAREEAEKLAAEAEAHANEGIDDTASELMDAAIKEEEKAQMIQESALTATAKSRGGFSSSSIKRTWTGEIEALAAVDLDRLRPYFKQSDIEDAINRAVRDGVRDIRGVKIYQKEQLSNRRR